MSLRPRALPRHRRSVARHRLQLLDLRQERLPASDRAAASGSSLSAASDALTTYRFNTGVAKHTFCATCGIHPFYVPRSDPDKIDVNVRCLDGVDVAAIDAEAVRRQELGTRDGAEGAVEICDDGVPLDGEIRDGRHVQTVRVYYEDTDFTGIVYHANYLRYMERGRTNYLRLLGADHRALFEETEKEAPGFAFVVRSMRSNSSSPRAWTMCWKSSPSRRR